MLHENFSKKKGFASLLLIKCECGFEKEFYSSQPAIAKTHDINRRIIYTMRSIGQGYSSIQKFTALMNMPQPMTQKNYDRSVKIISEVVQDVAEETMADAATELKENQGTNNPDVSVSCDGTWQRRAFSSLNGSFTAISVDSGKILDTEIMSHYCKSCKGKENLKKTNRPAYDEWFSKHDCKINHIGSAGAMEVVGAKRIFERSIEKHNLRYTKYLGDGDSKSFTSVKSTYPGIEVQKLECVGHIQKRIGTRLRNLKKNIKKHWWKMKANQQND